MSEVVVASGKGGTGKTSLVAAFAELAGRPVVCVDADVDAANLPLLLPGVDELWKPFVGGRVAEVSFERCAGCGECVAACRFSAAKPAGDGVRVDPLACEGCGVCALVCPERAVSLRERRAGTWTTRATRWGPLVHAELDIGAGNSGKLVARLREEARCLAEAHGCDLTLVDGPPGIGCPVHAAVTGASLLVLVTEPTPSGIHDIDRALDLARHFRLPAALVINKADLDDGGSQALQWLASERRVRVLGRIPFDPAVPRVLAGGGSPLEVPGVAGAVAGCWQALRSLLADLPQGGTEDHAVV